MRAPSFSRCRFSTVLPFVCLAMLALTTSASANVVLQQIAFDPFTNVSSQHRTIVGPDTFSFGSTIVAAAQAGRFYDDGASGIVVSTSTNNGFGPWTNTVLPGMTAFTNPVGLYDRVSDPSVAYDAKHNVWLIASLGLQPALGGTSGREILISRSTTGGVTWGNPVIPPVPPPPPPLLATSPTQNFDKPWIVCDNTPTSSLYGSCYTQWVDFASSNRLKVAYSKDAGLTWKLPIFVPAVPAVGGQLLVLPSGRVVVVFSNAQQSALSSVISNNGGITFVGPFTISTIAAADDPGTIRSDPLASAEISGDGKIFVVWADCRYRAGCPNAPGTPNDLVYKTSTNGTTWSPTLPSSAPARIPIDPTSSTVDHFIPGVAVDRLSSGASIRVAVAYYFYPNVLCTFATCQLYVGYISSADGGAHWTPATQLAGPMAMGWLPNTTQGRMVGDYISTSFDSVGLAHPVFPLAFANPTGDCATATPLCDQALYTPAAGLSPAPGGLTPTIGGPLPSGSPGNNPQKR
jgi:hypothetical protein